MKNKTFYNRDYKYYIVGELKDEHTKLIVVKYRGKINAHWNYLVMEEYIFYLRIKNGIYTWSEE